MPKKDKKILLGFLTIWCIVNLMQAFFTELGDDEAYYWVWSKHLDWGFYEHPPMVALFIKLGYLLFQNELGVRLAAVLGSTIVLGLVYVKLIQKDIWLYIALVSSVFLFHVGGFFTAPDTPLFIFTALFYILLKAYLTKENSLVVIGLILCIAAMFYSKYHSFIVVGLGGFGKLPISSEEKSFYLIASLSMVLFIPHLYWLFTEGTKGLEYALSDRFNHLFDLGKILGFLGGQLLIAGPLMGFILFYSLFAVKTKDRYERTLKWVTLGVFGFFFLSSFRGRAEANWTASAFIPLIVLSHKYLLTAEKLRKVAIYLSLPSVAIILIARLQLVSDIVPLTGYFDKHQEFKGWNDFANKVDSIAGNKPILTVGYQEASKLWFYTGRLSLPLSINRPNQFDYWQDYYLDLKDSAVLVAGTNHLNEDYCIKMHSNRSICIDEFKKFRDYRSAEVKVVHMPKVLKPNSICNMSVDLKANEHWPIIVDANRPLYLACNIFEKSSGKLIMWRSANTFIEEDIYGTSRINMQMITPKVEGEYYISFFLASDLLLVWSYTANIPIKIEAS